uniref:Uncharacterized protein n=1 Tax=Salarias fasciatus TaxID=181472 RepID=A0A672IXQ0_SALFA
MILKDQILENHTLVCYSLDAFLLLYCVVFTVFFFREKVSRTPGIFDQSEEPLRPKDSDPYQVLQPTKPKVRVQV